MKRILHRLLATTLLVLPFLFVSGPDALAQRNPDKELPLRELLSVPGKLVSEAKSSRPTTELKLTGYRVEEIKLPRQLNIELHGQQVAVDKAWRVTVQGGPFAVRAMPAVIWIDDQIVGNGIDPTGHAQAWIATIPEPSTWAMALIGGMFLLAARRRTRAR